MLQAEDTEAALAVLDRCNTCSAMNYLLADASGELADIEMGHTSYSENQTRSTLQPQWHSQAAAELIMRTGARFQLRKRPPAPPGRRTLPPRR